MKKLNVFFCMLLITLFIIYIFRFIHGWSTSPPIHLDEASFASPAIELIKHGKLGTSIHEVFIPGIGERTYWMPPLYILIESSFFKFFGIGVFQARILSLFINLLFFLVLMRVIQKFVCDEILYILISAIIILSYYYFFIFCSVARMDILCLLLGFSGLIMLLKKDSKFYTLLVGLLIGMSAMSHPFGFAYLLTALIYLSKLSVKKRIILMFGGFAIPLAIWAIYIFQDWHSFIYQFSLQFTRKQTTNFSLIISHLIKYTAYLVASLSLYTLSSIKHKRFYSDLEIISLVGLFTTTFMAIILHEWWYGIHPLPFLVLIFIIGLKKWNPKKNTLILCLVILFIVPSAILFARNAKEYLLFRGANAEFRKFVQKIDNKISHLSPKHIFVQGAPNLSIHVIKEYPSIQVFSPSGIKTNPRWKEEIFKKTDMIIFVRYFTGNRWYGKDVIGISSETIANKFTSCTIFSQSEIFEAILFHKLSH